MGVHLVLVFALATSSAVPPEACSGMGRKTELEMQIRESDLDLASAVKAAEKLREMVGQGRVGGEYHHGALNQLKILKGHVLLHQALADRVEFGAMSAEATDSQKSFCMWLAKDGFWYD